MPHATRNRCLVVPLDVAKTTTVNYRPPQDKLAQGLRSQHMATLQDDGAFLLPRLGARVAGLCGRRRQIAMLATQTPMVALWVVQLALPTRSNGMDVISEWPGLG
jgi:hypothetical protein